jgi:hypothetical protein
MIRAMWVMVYAVAVLVSLAIDVAARFCLNWIVAALCDDSGNLPRCLRWFQTFDDDCDAGMRARRNELRQSPPGDTWAAFAPFPVTWLDRYRNRALWLFRNSSYGFSYYLFGRSFKPWKWVVARHIDTPALTLFIATGPRGAFNVYYHGQFGMCKLGWKAWNYYVPAAGDSPARWKASPWGSMWRVPMTFSINPFKRKVG